MLKVHKTADMVEMAMGDKDSHADTGVMFLYISVKTAPTIGRRVHDDARLAFFANDVAIGEFAAIG